MSSIDVFNLKAIRNSYPAFGKPVTSLHCYVWMADPLYCERNIVLFLRIMYMDGICYVYNYITSVHNFSSLKHIRAPPVRPTQNHTSISLHPVAYSSLTRHRHSKFSWMKFNDLEFIDLVEEAEACTACAGCSSEAIYIYIGAFITFWVFRSHKHQAFSFTCILQWKWKRYAIDDI